MYFIGIDLAWSDRNPSAGAVIKAEVEHGTLIHWKPLGSNEEIIDFISRRAGNNPALVSIDAPLIVPNNTGIRPCDRQITREFRCYHAGTFPANRTRFKNNVRGEEIVRQLQTLNFSHKPYLRHQCQERQVVEVYPHPATIVLFNLSQILKYKARPGRSLKQRQSELARLQKYIAALSKAMPALEVAEDFFRDTTSLSGREFKAHEDILDAVVCAYIAYYGWYWGPQGYCVYGEPEKEYKTGYILVPRHAAFAKPS